MTLFSSEHGSKKRPGVRAILPFEWRKKAGQTHLAALREWGGIGVVFDDWLQWLTRIETPAKNPDFKGLYFAFALLKGNDAAFRLLNKTEVKGLLKAGKRAGYSASLVEEELQALIVRLPGGMGSSPLLNYRGIGTLGGFLRVILLRNLGRHVARESLIQKRASLPERVSPTAAAHVIEAERLRLARDIVSFALRRIGRRERLFLDLCHVKGMPLTRAAVDSNLLSKDHPHLRTAASRLHKRQLALFRDEILKSAKEVFGLTREAVQDLLDPAFGPWEMRL